MPSKFKVNVAKPIFNNRERLQNKDFHEMANKTRLFDFQLFDKKIQ
jgi:hypothetical protein